jgi:hypothetical protein
LRGLWRLLGLLPRTFKSMKNRFTVPRTDERGVLWYYSAVFEIKKEIPDKVLAVGS